MYNMYGVLYIYVYIHLKICDIDLKISTKFSDHIVLCTNPNVNFVHTSLKFHFYSRGPHVYDEQTQQCT